MVMVTGSARSGTTILAECLNNHPKIMCIADPMNEFFKGFVRYAYYRVENEKKTVNSPIDNFFFSGSKRVSQFIDETDLKHEIPDYLKKEILARTALRDCSDYCPEIKKPIQGCKAKSFDLLFLEILELLHKTYGKPGTVYFGVKTVWSEQLIHALARTFPNMFFVNIIRDPRAIVASHYVFENVRYPLLFNLRDWRKSIYYSWKYQQTGHPLFKKFMWTKYENLVDNPEDVLSSITDFVGIEYDKAMTKKSFKKPDTGYKDMRNITKISTQFKEKWKTVLPKGIVKQIETFCAPEMKKLGYIKMYPCASTDINTLISLNNIPYESLSEWCKEIVGPKEYYEKTWTFVNNLLETARLSLLNSAHNIQNSYLITDFFYEEDYYNFIKSDGKIPSKRDS